MKSINIIICTFACIFIFSNFVNAEEIENEDEGKRCIIICEFSFNCVDRYSDGTCRKKERDKDNCRKICFAEVNPMKY